MKKIIFVVIALFLIGSVFASTSISINSIIQKDRNGNIVSEAINVGDQVFVDANVFDSSGWNDLKQWYLSWDNSWVDCYYKNILNNNNVNYKCILTVTPTMNHSTDVYFNIQSSDGYKSVLLGNFNFNGIPFPSKNQCKVSLYCKRYNTICTKQCYHNKCSRTCQKTCASYGTRTVCTVI